MDIRERYNYLLEKKLNLDNIDEVISLKNECKFNNNYEYFYLTNLLIMDIYINENLLNDALNISYKNFDDLDPTLYKKIYVSLLERQIYIFIQKKNFQSAYRYANEKRKYIDTNDTDEVNRWYLEMAYIHDALNEKSRSLSDLIGILENNPDNNLKLIVLNNITKLYIDSKNIEGAKDYLNRSLELAYSINDYAGKVYCQYLNAKLYVLEDKKKFAIKLYNDIFRGKNSIDDEYLGYLVEYLTLLNDMNEYSEVKKISDRFMDAVDECTDLFLKKDFYKNYLRAVIFLVPSLSIETKKLYIYIEKIEEEIIKNNEQITIESHEDDKISQINAKLKETVERLEKVTNVINYSLISTNERECLFDFSKNLEKIVPFNRVTFIVFNRATFDAYPKFLDSYSKISTYDYKKERMYEREMNYSSLNGTIVEMLITGNKDVSIDFTDTPILTREVISGETYVDLKTRYLYATPLTYSGDLYACAIYTSNHSDITKPEDLVALKIANRLLEAKLVNLFYQESLRTQKNILQVAISGLHEGIYYFDIRNKRMYMDEAMCKFITINTRYLNDIDYCEFIKDGDGEKFFSREEKILSGDKYSIEYSLIINGEEVLVQDVGSPYFDKNGNVSFYICTINKILSNDTILKKEKTKYLYLLNNEALQKSLELLNEDEFSLLSFKLNKKNNNEFEKFYHLCMNFVDDVYLIEKDLYAIIIKETNNRVIDSYVNKFIRDLKGISVGLITYPMKYNDIKNLIGLSKTLHKEKDCYKKLDENDVTSFNQILYITNCVKEAREKNELELLYTPLYQKNNLLGYFINYNVKGIYNNNDVLEYLDDSEKILFDLFVLEKLNKQNIKVYQSISAKTLSWMKDNDYFDNVMLNDNIVLCLHDYSNDIDDIIAYIKSYNINIFIDYELLDILTIKSLTDNAITGVVALKDSSDEFIEIISSLNKLVLSDNYVEKDNFIYYDGKTLKKEEISL